jgi:hypothetical protein
MGHRSYATENNHPGIEIVDLSGLLNKLKTIPNPAIIAEQIKPSCNISLVNIK